jgi:hypothetical protein
VALIVLLEVLVAQGHQTQLLEVQLLMLVVAEVVVIMDILEALEVLVVEVLVVMEAEHLAQPTQVEVVAAHRAEGLEVLVAVVQE